MDNNNNKHVSIIGYVSFDNQRPGEHYDAVDVAKDFDTMESLGTLVPHRRVMVVPRDDQPGNIRPQSPG